MRRLKTVRRPPIYPKTPGHLPCSSLTHPLPLSSRRLSVSFGGFGIQNRLEALRASIEEQRAEIDRLEAGAREIAVPVEEQGESVDGRDEDESQ